MQKRYGANVPEYDVSALLSPQGLLQSKYVPSFDSSFRMSEEERRGGGGGVIFREIETIKI